MKGYPAGRASWPSAWRPGGIVSYWAALLFYFNQFF